MPLHRRWRRARRRGIAEIIGVVLLVALTLIAGIILWSFRIYTPPAPPSINFVIRSGGSNPVWGDPTDCQPWGYDLSFYTATQSSANLTTWLGKSSDGPTTKTWYGQCGDGDDGAVTGNYSALNSTEFIISAHSPSNIPLADIDFTFVCNNASDLGGTTVLLNGSLASMTWFPGSTTAAAADAPYLGYCGSFDARDYGNAAVSTLYNRLALFVPLNQGVSSLENGDTFILYIHNGGFPIDFMCVADAAGVIFDGQSSGKYTDCVAPLGSNGRPEPLATLDYDDYHGAPPWCFASMNACTIYLTYTGYPSAVLAKIPVYSLAPPSAQ